jgi:ribose-phosphate pyrophosphokinase
MKKQPDFILEAVTESQRLVIIPVNNFTFPDGEPSVKLELSVLDERVESFRLIASLKNSEKLIQMIKIVDAIRNQYFHAEIEAFIPYIPGTRGDRVMDKGEAFSMRIYSEFINSCDFSKIYTLDPHSDVTNALINNLVVIPNVHHVSKAIYIATTNQKVTLVSPDSGFNKKVKSLAQKINSVKDILYCDKTRDVKTGKITGFSVYADTLDPEEDYFIVDDICDGGGTFIGLAEQMRKKGAKKIHLFVTHGIFSKGFEPLMQQIDTVHYLSVWEQPEYRNVFKQNYDFNFSSHSN